MLLFSRFQCEHNPIDKNANVKIKVEKLFVAHLKKKLSTNQKNALK